MVKYRYNCSKSTLRFTAWLNR